MRNTDNYTIQLTTGLGMINETRNLLSIWEEGMSSQDLYRKALNSGIFPTMSARRLQNFVTECFAPRYMRDDGGAAALLKKTAHVLSSQEYSQLLFVYTCRANRILGDFVRRVYWERYSAGHETVGMEHSREFILKALDEGKMKRSWSEGTIDRVSGYLLGCCVDFGLLDRSIMRSERRILSFRVLSATSLFLAHNLHFMGYSDTAVASHEDWGLFGLEPNDVREELRALSLAGNIIFQSAGELLRIGWKFKSMEELADGLAQG